MVYCTKCGTENLDDAEVCSNCGASLNETTTSRYRRRDWDFDDACFGGRSRQTWPLLFGVFLILIGVSSLLDDVFWWASFDQLWPLFIIAVGLLVVTSGMRRR
ncbi:MAG: zinc-ribbon domain-containing protein [Candidatus Bathyarchaeota archaeon]|nr:zinc-ribbon domain-containing protein [Candidatus Bathyarchaeota archaeon]